MKTWHFIGISIILLGLAIVGLRNNNIEVNNIRAQIEALDTQGEDVRDMVETDLKDFVFSHMNASVEIFLAGAYNRKVTQAQEDINQSGQAQVYQDAMDQCDREGRPLHENTQCVRDYMIARMDDNMDLSALDISRADFTYRYYSPKWTPDMAGLSLLGAAISGLIAFILYIRYFFKNLIVTR
ncbi:MAG: hypothetical protein WD061_02125 [Candidatus Saccharimonadales bacterium]